MSYMNNISDIHLFPASVEEVAEMSVHHSRPDCCSCDEPIKGTASVPATAGNSCCGSDQSRGQEHGESNLWRQGVPVAIALFLLAIGLFFNEPLRETPFAIAEYAVLIPAYLISGWSVLTTAGRNILRGRIFDENFLMMPPC